MSTYNWLGKRVEVTLITKDGQAAGTIIGTVTDAAPNVEVAPGMLKDLVRLERLEGAAPGWVNSGGGDDDMWAAVHDLREVTDEPESQLFSN